MPSLDSVNAAIIRAHEHLQTLTRESQKIVETLNREGIEGGEETSSGDYVWRVRAESSITTHICTTAGDFIQNLRAALDYLITELSDPGQRSRSEFPIFLRPCEGKDGLNQRAKTKIATIPSDAQDIVENLQPFADREEADAKTHPLWLIHDLDRIRKHRRLLAIPFAVQSVGIGLNRDNTLGQRSFVVGKMRLSTGRFKDGDVVPRVSSPYSAKTVTNMRLNVGFVLSLAEDGVEWGPIDEQLNSLYDYAVHEVLPQFEPFFD